MSQVCLLQAKNKPLIVRHPSLGETQIFTSQLMAYEMAGWEKTEKATRCDCIECWKRKKLAKAARLKSAFGGNFRF